MKSAIITIIGVVLGVLLYTACLVFIYWGDIPAIGLLTKAERVEILVWGIFFTILTTIGTHATSVFGE